MAKTPVPPPGGMNMADLMNGSPQAPAQAASAPAVTVTPAPASTSAPSTSAPPVDYALPAMTSLSLVRTFCAYGETGTYKTSEIKKVMKYLLRKYPGKRIRYITTEPGSMSTLNAMIRIGLVDVLVLDDQLPILSVVEALRKGYWKPIVFDQGTGMLKMTKPRKVQIPLTGEELSAMGIDPADPRAPKTRTATELQEPISGIFVDGLTTLAKRYLRSISRKGKTGADTMVEDSLIDGQAKSISALPTQSNYLSVQTFMLDVIADLSSLPVEMVGFSAHEGRGKDPQTMMPLNGPGLVGKAATADVAPMVGDLFHFETVERDSGRVTAPLAPGEVRLLPTTVRAYFDKHPDSDAPTVLWPAKPRWPDWALDKLWQRWPGGYLDLQKDSLADYFSFRDQVEAEEMEELKDLIERKG